MTASFTIFVGKMATLNVNSASALSFPFQKMASTVQVGAYYYSKVLDLEEYLFHDQLMKYNLRFYWKTPGRDNNRFEDYGHSYIRTFSNIACYQLDRNTFEAELLRRNCADSRLSFHSGTTDLDVSLNEGGPHDVRYVSRRSPRSEDAVGSGYVGTREVSRPEVGADENEPDSPRRFHPMGGRRGEHRQTLIFLCG
jgi:hypothetical protein